MNKIIGIILGCIIFITSGCSLISKVFNNINPDTLDIICNVVSEEISKKITEAKCEELDGKFLNNSCKLKKYVLHNINKDQCIAINGDWYIDKYDTECIVLEKYFKKLCNI